MSVLGVVYESLMREFQLTFEYTPFLNSLEYSALNTGLTAGA
jgi:hypothetical protein